jgi:hypothetical protein
LDASLLALLLTSAQAAPVAGPAVTPDSGVLTPTEHRRTPDQTFLTFPEWYLVHSPAEYAHFLAHAEHPSAFPLFAHIGQFWQSYAAVTKEIQRFPFNGGYHLMVMVIGSSTTVEYTLKGLYEHTIGRLAEATKSEAQVPEERFAAAYAQSYVDFIRVEPWYQYDFLAQFQQLWREVPLRGPDLTRRWERRYLLSCELLVKAGYARLIKLGTQTIYQAPKPTTAVVLDHLPPVDPAHPDFTLLRPAEPGQPVLATIPRYEGFTTYAKWLAAQDLHFVEVAGNRGDILVSELAPQGWRPHAGRVLFEQPILTEPGRQRVAFALPVAQLAQALREAAGAGGSVQVEHIYDF